MFKLTKTIVINEATKLSMIIINIINKKATINTTRK